MCSGTDRVPHRLAGRVVSVLVSATLVFSPSFLSALTAHPVSGGSLDIVTDPAGAVVYVDGTFAGHTPLTLADVTAGEHRVRLLRNGYLENSRVVSVEAGERSTLDVRLTRDTTGTAAAVAPGDSLLANKWFWVGVAGAAGAAVFVLTKSGGNKAPTVGSVTASPSIGLAASSSIAFSAQGSDPDGDSMTYSWDFGDGSTGSGSSPTHTYSSAGTYTVRVTVSDGESSASGTTSVTIRSLTGTWDGNFFGGTVVTLTQNGSSVTGTWQDQDGVGTVTGFVQSSSPRVNLSISQFPFQFGFAGDPDSSINSITGSFSGDASGPPGTITRR